MCVSARSMKAPAISRSWSSVARWRA